MAFKLKKGVAILIINIILVSVIYASMAFAAVSHKVLDIKNDQGISIDSTGPEGRPDGLVDIVNKSEYAKGFFSLWAYSAGDCVIRYNSDKKYATSEWMACPKGYYISAITDDFANSQDITCCPLFGEVTAGDGDGNGNGGGGDWLDWLGTALQIGAAIIIPTGIAYLAFMVGGVPGAIIGGLLGILVLGGAIFDFFG